MVCNSTILEDIPSYQIPDWMNEQLFRDCLKSEYPSKDIIVNIISIKPAVAAGENYASIIYRAKVEIYHDNEQKIHGFILKCVLPFAEESYKEMNFFDKEIEIYGKFLPAFEKLYKEIGEDVQLGPKLYKILPGKCKVLIFEDLCLRNFEVMDRRAGLDFDHCKLYHEKIAKLHAVSAVYRERHGDYDKDLFVPIFHESVKSMKISLENLYPYFLNSIRENKNLTHLTDKVANWNGKFFDKLSEICKPSDETNAFNVLCHGDPWVTNFLYSHDNNKNPSNILFIDFQLSFYGSPITDIYYFFASSTQPNIKEKEFDHLIFHYHTSLVENLNKLNYTGKIPSLRELHIDLLKHGFYAAAMAILIMAISLVEPREDAKMDSLVFESEESADLKRSLFNSPLYVKNLEALFLFLDSRGLLEI